MKKYLPCLIAPAAVAGILLSLFFIYGMYPFGSLSLSWCDMDQQVIPFLMDFKDILSGKADLFLNLQNAGGMSFWGVFLFFISSPFSFLVALVSKSELYHLVNVLVLLKLMVCALTAGVFFRRQLPKLPVLQIVAFSVMYAFCGYAMLYYQNHVWLDIMYLFPVLLIGLSRLIHQGRIGLYIFALSATLTVNFYLSYMVFLFLILAFGVYLLFFAQRSVRGRSTLLLGAATVLAVLLTAGVWLPSLLQYLNSARTGSLLASLWSGGLLTRWDTTLPVLFCSGAVLAGFLLYFQPLPGGRSRLSRFVFWMFVLTAIPVLIDPINKMWHTGSYQAFPVRYGYITVLFGILLYAIQLAEENEANGLPKPREFHLSALLAGAAGTFAVFLLAYELIGHCYGTLTVYTRALWGSPDGLRLFFAFFAVSGLAYYGIALLFRFHRFGRTACSVFLCLVVLIECVFNATVYLVSPAHDTAGSEQVTDLGDRIEDKELYRVKMGRKYFDVNLMGGIGYPSLGHYTSLTGKEFLFFMKKMGYSSYWMEVNSSGGTEFSDAILCNRYHIVKTGEMKDTDTPVYRNAEYSILRSRNTVPFGFVFDCPDIASIQSLPDTTREEIQQYLFRTLFHTEKPLFSTYEPTKLTNVTYHEEDRWAVSLLDPAQMGTISYEIPVKGTQTLYFDCFDQLSNRLTEHINGTFRIYVDGLLQEKNYPSQKSNGILNLGTYTDCTVLVQVVVSKDFYAKSFGVFGLNPEVLKQAVASAETAQLRQEKNQIVGSAYAKNENDYLFLPVNYGYGGYSVLINGRKTDVARVFDSMMAVKLEKGENRISVAYVPPGVQAGTWICAAGILALVGFLLLLKKGQYGKIRFLEFPAEIAFALLFAAVLFGVYLFPLLIRLKR